MILLAVDPDLFYAAETDWHCEQTLNDVFINLDQYCLQFAVDDNGPVRNEITEAYLYWFEHDPEHQIAKLLQLIEEETDTRKLISTTLDPSCLDLLFQQNCMDPVEPELIGFVANVDHHENDLRLVLVGEGVGHPKLRSRKLNEAAVRNNLKLRWPWLNVRFAVNSRFESSIFDDQGQPHPKSKDFEGKVAIKLQTIRGNLRCIESPVPEKIQGRNIGDIDVYGLIEQSDHLTVLVGECKLREEGRETKRLVTTEELGKLYTRMEAVRNHISTQKLAKGRQVIIEGIVVSNAAGLEESAIIMAKSYKIAFYQAQLTRNWEQDLHWKINSLIQIDL